MKKVIVFSGPRTPGRVPLKPRRPLSLPTPHTGLGPACGFTHEPLASGEAGSRDTREAGAE